MIKLIVAAHTVKDYLQTMINALSKKLGLKALKPGTMAPDFILKDQHNTLHKLSDYKGKWLVLYFYPKDHTFGCTQEACSFRDESQEFTQRGVTVLGVSCDSAESHQDFSKKHELNFPLLADDKKEVSQSYGILSPLGFSNRVTFIIDPEGNIADTLSWVNWFSYGSQVLKRIDELKKTTEG